MGSTKAQLGYEGRNDLGNTEPGDGKKFAGHTAMQITGRDNTRRFRDWCRKFIDPKAPDFVEHPELMNTDPREGLGPIWYWTVGNPTGQSLNRYADQGAVENITRKINDGLNGFAERVDYLVRVSLVMLGFGPTDVRGFQKSAGVKVDGDPGPKTRAALHQALVRQTVPVRCPCVSGRSTYASEPNVGPASAAECQGVQGHSRYLTGRKPGEPPPTRKGRGRVIITPHERLRSDSQKTWPADTAKVTTCHKRIGQRRRARRIRIMRSAYMQVSLLPSILPNGLIQSFPSGDRQF